MLKRTIVLFSGLVVLGAMLSVAAAAITRTAVKGMMATRVCVQRHEDLACNHWPMVAPLARSNDAWLVDLPAGSNFSTAPELYVGLVSDQRCAASWWVRHAYRFEQRVSVGAADASGARIEIGRVQLETFGWPRPVLADVEVRSDQAAPAVAERLHSVSGRRMLWSGIASNGLIFAGAVALFAAPFIVLNASRRSRRRNGGCCEACGYPVGCSPLCTECGAMHRRAGS